eukprot:353880-Chlamydomonas_euryale.AAC.3
MPAYSYGGLGYRTCCAPIQIYVDEGVKCRAPQPAGSGSLAPCSHGGRREAADPHSDRPAPFPPPDHHRGIRDCQPGSAVCRPPVARLVKPSARSITIGCCVARASARMVLAMLASSDSATTRSTPAVRS